MLKEYRLTCSTANRNITEAYCSLAKVRRSRAISEEDREKLDSLMLTLARASSKLEKLY